MKYFLMGFSITCLIFILFQPKASAVKFEENKHKQKITEYTNLQVSSSGKSLAAEEKMQEKEHVDSTTGKRRDKNKANLKIKEKRKRIKKSPNETKMSILKKICTIWLKRMYCNIKKLLEKIGWSWYQSEQI